MPVALLLGIRFNLRFIKLERRSPTIDKLASTKPINGEIPIKGDTNVVANSADATPLIVFDEPKTGCPSKNLHPPSSG